MYKSITEEESELPGVEAFNFQLTQVTSVGLSCIDELRINDISDFPATGKFLETFLSPIST
jgi:hypothetical protein